MPGILTSSGTRAAPGTPVRVIGSQYAVAGITTRGPTAPTIVESMTDFEREFGGAHASGFLHADLDLYFSEGGTRAVVLRGVGPAATKGTLTLLDRAGTPVATVRLDARDPGPHSSTITAAVANGTLANTVTLTLTFAAGTRDEFAEVYRNIANPAALVAAITARPSRLVTAANLGSATASPNNNPAVLAATALSAGTDDLAAVTFTTLVDLFATWGKDRGPAAIAIPGYVAGDVGPGLIAHGNANRRVELLHVARTATATAAKADAATLAAVTGSEGALLAVPYVHVPDGTGGTKALPPTGYVAAKRALAIQQVGVTQPGAGIHGKARYVSKPDVEYDRTAGDDLNLNGVSAIRTIRQRDTTDTRVYGWRSVRTDEAGRRDWYLLTMRDALNLIEFDLDVELEDPAVFARIDSRSITTNRVASLVKGRLEDYRAAGDLYERRENGELIDPGYTIQVTAVPAERRIDVLVGVRLAEAAELVVVRITKSAVDLPL